MNTKILVALFVVGLVGIGGYLLSRSKDPVTPRAVVTSGARDVTNTMMQQGMHTMPDGTMMGGTMEKTPSASVSATNDAMPMDHSMMSHGTYEAYSADKIARAATGDVVLFFRASWCPTCKVLDSDLKLNLMDIPKDVTILDVNYDTETALKEKYGVTYQHTLVQVDAQGLEKAKWSGSRTLTDLVANIK